MALSLPSSSSFNTSNALAADARSLDRLKFAAGSSPEATREAAKQFESLFMREMIKSMREADHEIGPARQRPGRPEHRPAGPAAVGADVRPAGRPVRSHCAPALAGDGRRCRAACTPGRTQPGHARPAHTDHHAHAPRQRTRPPRPRRLCGTPERHRRARGPGQRHSGRLHARPGRARNRLGQERNQECRRFQLVQPVRHQGGQGLDRQGRRSDHHRVHRRHPPQGCGQVPGLRLV